MSAITGKGGKVMYGSVVLANIDEWSIDGFTMETIGTTAFNVSGSTNVNTFISTVGDGGSISFKGNYDPADSTGQRALAAVCQAGAGLTNLYLYANTSTFWRVGSGGEIIVTKTDAVTLPRSNKGTINFQGKVSGAAMEQVGTGT